MLYKRHPPPLPHPSLYLFPYGTAVRSRAALLVRESGAAPEDWWGGVARAAWVLVPKRARASPRGIGGPEACARRGVETRPFFYAVHTMPPYRARRFVSPPPHTRPPPPLSAAPPRAPRERPEALLAGGAGALARPPLLRTKPELWRVLRRQPLNPPPPRLVRSPRALQARPPPPKRWRRAGSTSPPQRCSPRASSRGFAVRRATLSRGTAPAAAAAQRNG